MKRPLQAVLMGCVMMSSAAVVYAQDSMPKVDAQDQTVTKDVVEAVNSTVQRTNGWYPTLRLGGSAALNYNKNVVGVSDGLSLMFGLQLKGGLDLVYGNFEWHNNLLVEHQQTKTTTMDTFVKSLDVLRFSTLMLYRIPKVEWLGPFARAQVDTSIFPGSYYAEKPTSINYQDPDGSEMNKDARGSYTEKTKRVLKTVLQPTQTQELTTWVEPIVVTESIGALINPYTSDPITINMRVGAAGQHLFARDGFIMTKKTENASSGTLSYEARELTNMHSFGIDGNMEMNGKMFDIVLWSVSAGVYYPFKTTKKFYKSEGGEKKELKGIDLLHTDIQAKLSIAIAKWASLDYSLGVKKQPFVSQEWQISNTMLLTLGFDIF